MQFTRDDKSAKRFSSLFVDAHKIRSVPFYSHLATFVLLFACVTSLAVGQSPSGGYGSFYPSGHPDRVWIERLIESRLYDVAIELTKERMASVASNRNSNEKTQWLFLWMESKMALAASRVSDAYEKPANLDAELKEIRDALTGLEEDPRKSWIQFKEIWCQWFLLRSAVAGYLAAPTRIAIRDWSLRQIRQSLEEIEKLEEAISQTPTKGLPSFKPEGIDMSQFRALQAETNLLECDFLHLRALLYLADSDERISAGTQMMTTLEDAEKRVGLEWAEKPKLAIARGRALLLLSRPQDAVQAMEGLYDKLPPERIDWRVQASSIAAEGTRTMGKVSDSDAWIQRVGGWDAHPTLAIEYFANRLTSTAASDAKAMQRVLEIKKSISDRFGGYWASRADALLVASHVKTAISAEPATTNVSLELLRIEVKQLIAAKKWLPAIEKLGQAEMAAANQSNTDQALELAMQAAALWGIQRNYLAAGNEFQRAAMAYSTALNAPNSAMHAIAMLQQHVKQIEKDMSLAEDERKSALDETIGQQKVVWTDTLSIWPLSEQADASVRALEEYFLSTDNLVSIVELWMQRTVRLQESVEEKKPPAKDNYDKYVAARDRSLLYASLLSILSQSNWIDASLVGADGAAKQDRIVLLFRELEQRFVAMPDPIASKSATELRKQRLGLGWEWPSGPFHSDATNESASMLMAWGQCELQFHTMLRTASPDEMTVASLGRSIDSLEKKLSDETKQRLGPQFRKSVTRSLALFRIAIGLRKDPNGEAKKELLDLEMKAGRDPFWIYYSARILSHHPGEGDNVLNRYRQIAAGCTAGSAGWLECRARTCQTLRALNRIDEASTLSKLVLATYSQLDPVWKTRFGGY